MKAPYIMLTIASLRATCQNRLHIFAAVGLLFGVVTLISSGRVLFGDSPLRQMASQDVLSIVWFNFYAGFAYIIAAIGLFKRARWAAWLASTIVGATLIAAATYTVNKLSGGSSELLTAWALGLRAGVWLIIAMAAKLALQKNA